MADFTISHTQAAATAAAAELMAIFNGASVLVGKSDLILFDSAALTSSPFNVFVLSNRFIFLKINIVRRLR